jgi:3-oxoacyl-[acyl-carrier protein] reductase
MGDDVAARVALVTGAAGGLGQGLVQEFSQQGWRVAATYHQREPEVAQTDELFVTRMDVTSRASVEEAVKKVRDRWGRIDALVNNAGVTADGLTSHLSQEDWDQVLAVNLKGAFLCAQAVLPLMLRQRDGHILNVSSFSGRSGQRGQANYASAKAGLIGLTQSLAREVGSRNIRVNAILPGVLPTAMTAALDPERLAEFAAANSLGRIGSVAEVSKFIVFLTTLQNVSGQVFQLDSRIARWT